MGLAQLRSPEPRRCPDGTTGQMAQQQHDCQAKTDLPIGLVRKGKACVAVTTGGSSGSEPPRAAHNASASNTFAGDRLP